MAESSRSRAGSAPPAQNLPASPRTALGALPRSSPQVLEKRSAAPGLRSSSGRGEVPAAVGGSPPGTAAGGRGRWRVPKRGVPGGFGSCGSPKHSFPRCCFVFGGFRPPTTSCGGPRGPKQPQSLQVNTGTPPLGAQTSEDPNGHLQEKSKDGVRASGDFMKFFTPRANVHLFHFTAKTTDR